jgi:hypothetical protein
MIAKMFPRDEQGLAVPERQDEGDQGGEPVENGDPATGLRGGQVEAIRTRSRQDMPRTAR